MSAAHTLEDLVLAIELEGDRKLWRQNMRKQVWPAMLPGNRALGARVPAPILLPQRTLQDFLIGRSALSDITLRDTLPGNS